MNYSYSSSGPTALLYIQLQIAPLVIIHSVIRTFQKSEYIVRPLPFLLVRGLSLRRIKVLILNFCWWVQLR
jgi:hypothetical protein